MISRRDLLTTAPLAVAGLAVAERPMQPPNTLPPMLVTELYDQLARVVHGAKNHSLKPQDLSKLHGMLTMVFPLWIMDGTLDKLQAGYNPKTFIEPADLRANLANHLQGVGVDLVEADFAIFDHTEVRDQVPTDLYQIVTQILEMQEAQVKQAGMVRNVVSEICYGSITNGLNYTPISYHYRKTEFCEMPFMPIGLAAGMTAALGFFNPIIVAVFGTIAALAFIGDWLFC